jgi:hypothetical protein
LVLHQEPHGEEPIGARGDISRRAERRFQHDTANPVIGSDRDCDA